MYMYAKLKIHGGQSNFQCVRKKLCLFEYEIIVIHIIMDGMYLLCTPNVGTGREAKSCSSNWQY